MHNTTTLFDDDTLTVATTMSGNVGGVCPLRMPGAHFKNLFQIKELGGSFIQVTIGNFVI